MTTTAPPPAGRLELPPLDAVCVRRGRDRLIVARRASVPLVQVRALLPGPGGPRARLAAATLLRRPGVLERLEDIGATAEAAARPDGLLLSLCAEPAQARSVVSLLLDLLRPAAPAPAAVLASEAARLAGLDAVARRDAGECTRHAALDAVFGSQDPLAEAASDLGEIAAEAVQQWLAECGDALLVLCGDVSTGDEWGDPAEAVGATPQPRAARGQSRPRWGVTDRPGSEQTTLRAAAPVAAHGSTDRAAIELLQRLLGGGKGSRLVRELRERRGYGYHPGTSVVDLATGSYLLLEADVATDVTADAVRVVDEVLESTAGSPPQGEELELGRRGVIGDLSRMLDAQGTLADLLLTLAAAGQDATGVSALARAVVATDTSDVQRVAAQVLEQLRGAAAADMSTVREQDLPASWSARG